jgi:hypothetical protein
MNHLASMVITMMIKKIIMMKKENIPITGKTGITHANIPITMRKELPVMFSHPTWG